MNIIDLLKCPNCGNVSLAILKEWNYGVFRVKHMKCSSCQKSFKAYFKQGKFSHITDNTGNYNKILRYLKKHDATREEEIANALHLSVEEVLNVLIEMEKRGKVTLSPES